MKIQLDTPNPAVGADNIDEINTNNVKKLQLTMNRTGINTALLLENSTQTNFTSTTYTQVLNMLGIASSSGGFFEINFKTSVFIPSNQNIFLQLYVDTLIKDFAVIGTSADVIQQVSLNFRGSLGEGRHTIKVFAKVDGGTFNLSSSGSITRLQAVEIVL